jgi:hypothetical protein
LGLRGRIYGPWPGRGPFSYLPPWQRPGWMYGRGACWRLFGAWYTPFYRLPNTPDVNEQIQILEDYKNEVETELNDVKKEIDKLKKETKDKDS